MFCIDEKTGKVYVKENTLDREVRHRTHSTCAAAIFVHTNSKSFIRLFFNLNCMTYMALQAECNDLEVISHNDRIQNTFAQSFSLMGSKHHSLFCLNVLSFSHHLNHSQHPTYKRMESTHSLELWSPPVDDQLITLLHNLHCGVILVGAKSKKVGFTAALLCPELLSRPVKKALL